MLDFFSEFFDASIQLDLAIWRNDLKFTDSIKYQIGLLKRILHKSIQKFPSRKHTENTLFLKQRIIFYENAFKIGNFNMK